MRSRMTTGPDVATLVARPQMPTQEDQDRSVHQLSRYQMLGENWDDLANDYNETRVDPERLATWGPPHTESNLLAEIATQLSTPGLYATRPAVTHSNPAAQRLVGPRGYLDRARYWALMQHIQYMTTGLSDMLVQLDVVRGRLVAEPVYPHDVYIAPHPTRYGETAQIWRLRLRYLPAPLDRWVWAWDKWILGDYDVVNGERVETEPPRFVVEAASGELLGEPITNLVIPGAPQDGYVGESYRWRYADGVPFAPIVKYADMYTGAPWNWTRRRGAMRGALGAQLAWTYTGHAAQDASGRTVLAAGLIPAGGSIQGAGTQERVRSVQLSPGTIVYHDVEHGSQPFVQEVGPGANVEELLNYALTMEARQLRRFGVDEAGAEKTASDPVSGAAKFVSRQQKREFADRVRPLYEASDLDVVRISAAMLRVAGVDLLPEDGYSIEYAPIPRSSDELAAERDDLDWQRQSGLISQIDLYMRRHPGVSEADARAALVRVARQEADLANDVAAATAQTGPVAGAPVGAPTDAAAVADTALNGAQVEALSSLVSAVSAGQTSPSVAKLLLPVMFPTIRADAAERIIDEAAAFKPAPDGADVIGEIDAALEELGADAPDTSAVRESLTSVRASLSRA